MVPPVVDNPSDAVDEGRRSSERLSWLTRDDLLQLLNEQSFQELTEFARDIFDVEHAAITLMDETNLWINACPTTDLDRIDKNQSACEYTIGMDEDVLVIEDMQDDERTRHRDLITLSDLSFYAGSPITFFDGWLNGSFCVLDGPPRTFDEDQRERLHQLKSHCENLIDQKYQLLRSREAISLFEGVFDATADGLLILNEDGVVDFNDQFQELFDLHREPAAEEAEESVFDRVRRQLAAPGEFDEIVESILDGTADQRYHEVRLEDGRILELYCIPRTVEDQQQGWVFSFRDVTENRRQHQKLEAMAEHDELTGLLNRRTFEERLARRLGAAELDEESMAVLALDLHHFNRINEAIGYEGGDQVLREIAHRLSEVVPERGFLCRFEGDKFMILQPGVEADADVHGLEERIHGAFDEPIEKDGMIFQMLFDIGVAMAPRHSKNAQELVRMASKALDKSVKETSDRSLRFYLDSMEDFDVNLLDLESDFRRALRTGELKLHYQPKVSLPDETIRGMESLIRWTHPEQGRIIPPVILQLAQSTGLTYELDKYVLRQSVEFLGRCHNRGQELRCSVNVSAPTFHQGSEFVDDVAEILEEGPVSGKDVELEITEGTAMDDAELTQDVLEDLRALGPSIAVDDFGTGYSSHAYLSRFPIDTLKIDRKFIDGVAENPKNQKLVGSMISLARNLDLDVVAEGPEREEEVRFLTESETDYAQGYYFSRPLPSEEFFEYLAD